MKFRKNTVSERHVINRLELKHEIAKPYAADVRSAAAMPTIVNARCVQYAALRFGWGRVLFFVPFAACRTDECPASAILPTGLAHSRDATCGVTLVL